MVKVPRAAFDSTLALMREGYPFIWNRCQRFQSDLFVTRIMGKPAVCIHGPEAARLFYDDSKLQRHGAVPRRVATSLFGKQAVHTLDDDEHRHRKRAFMSLMTPTHIEQLMACMEQHWRAAIRRWEVADSIVLFDEVQRILTAAVCEWAGVPLPQPEVALRARQLGRMVDAFGGIGPRLWRGKLARASAQRWLGHVVQRARYGAVAAAPGSALHVFAQHRSPAGRLISTRTAAVELLNVIRPTSAIAWYVADAAQALHMFPETREKLAADSGDFRYATLFMHELRRFYPFTPYLGARVRARFHWRGHLFKPRTLVLLDVYGGSRDPRLWQDPDAFCPERFEEPIDHLYDFIPQGGGNPTRDHRCAGEWITMESIRLALRFLVQGMSYEVERYQDLSLDLARMPTRPTSGVVLTKVRARPVLAEPHAAFDAHISPQVTASVMSSMRDPPV